MKLRKGCVKVVAAQRLRVSRCQGTRTPFRPSVPSWRLWLKCGHMERRRSEEPPRQVKCWNCFLEEEHGWRYSRQWKRGDIPDDFDVVRFR
jgi:hypothetical protein